MTAEKLAKSSRPPPGKASAPSRRGKGRPLGGRDSVGREALIKAARDLLRTTAPREVTRDAVARFAGVDPALVRYYFGDRNGLLTAVAAEISREMHVRMAAAVEAGTTSEEKLRNRTHAVLAVHTEYPHLNELMIQQIVHGGAAAAKQARREMVVDSVASLSRIVEEGMARGEFRPVDPRLLHIAMIGMYDFFFTGRPVVEEIFGKRAANRELTTAYGEFLNGLLLNGLLLNGGRADAQAEPLPSQKSPAPKTSL